MFSLLLAIIYLAFISLGLPDSLLGSAWPVMQPSLGVPISYAGLVTMIICMGTIISSLCSDRLTSRFGPGKVTAFSVLATAVALFGFSFSTRFWQLCLWAIPYGLGAGAIDAALNNYVAVHYSSRQMSWLHGCWGLGVSISPMIMSAALSLKNSWPLGYRAVGIFQTVLTAVMFLSLPLWKKALAKDAAETPDTKEAADSPAALVDEESTENRTAEAQPEHKPATKKHVLRIPGLILILVAFFAYCAVEQTAMLWSSSYLVHHRAVPEETAAALASLFLIGITVGRFLNGFVADKFGDFPMIRFGTLLTILGIVLVAVPFSSVIPAYVGLVLIGLGCAPIYPCIIHSTPSSFGVENSQAAVGVQMASAYIGSTFMPPLFGLIAQHLNIALFPAYLGACALLLLVMTEVFRRKYRRE